MRPAENIFEEVPCNLCGERGFRVRFYSAADLNDPVDPSHFLVTTDRYGGYGRIVSCTRCGLTYTNPRIKAEKALEGYRSMVDLSYERQEESRSRNARFSLNTIKRFLSEGRLLDVGCATGYFLNAARSQFECSGVEPSLWAARHAREKLGLDVAPQTLKEASFPDQSFDGVTLIDTIEHVHDPLAELREVSRITRPGGWIYLVTPDIASFAARILGGKWWGLRPSHLYYFSPRTLKLMLQMCGYEIRRFGSFGKTFTWSYWASRLKNYPPFLHRGLNRLIDRLHLQHRFLHLNTRDSIEVVARKKPSL